APLAPTIALAIDSSDGAAGHNNDLRTNNATLTISAAAEPVIREYSIDGGSWNKTYIAPTADGSHTVAVRDTDVAGNTATGSLTFTLDTTVVAPTIVLATDSSDGAVGHNIDLRTNDAALSISAAAEPVIRDYSIDGGSWNTTYTAPSADGNHTVAVRDTDVAGNTATGNLSFTRDTTAPLAPTVALVTDSSDGAVGHNIDLITNDAALSIGAAAEPVTREYSIDGGSWSSTYTGPGVDGSHTVAVRDTDVAGNVSGSTTLSFTLDTIAPTAPIVSLFSDTGVSASDHITNSGALSLSGIETGTTVEYSTDGGSHWSSSFAAGEGTNTVDVRQTDVAGNVSGSTALSFTLDTTVPVAPGAVLTTDTGVSSSDQITNSGALTLSGIETGATVEYSTDGGSLWSSSFTASEGANTVDVRQIDVAGNVSGSTVLSFTLDTISPAAPNVTLTTDTGVSSSDQITNSGALTLSGIEPGATVEYSTDGGSHWSNSFAASEGANTVDVRQIDVAGNTSSAGSLTFTLDTTSPKPVVTAITDDTGAPGDHITSDTTLIFSGTAEANSTVMVFIDTVPKGTTTTDGTGTWIFDYTGTPLVNGTYSITAQVTDAAGNISVVSDPYAMTISTAPPSPTIFFDGNITADNIINIAEAGSSNVAITGHVGGDAQVGDTVTLTVNSYTYTGLVQGDKTFSINVAGASLAADTSISASVTTDWAGISGTDTITKSYSVDTIAPIAPTVGLTSDTGADNSDLITSNAALNIGAAAGRTFTVEGGIASSSYIAPTADGLHTVVVTDTDAAGNQSSGSLSFTLDTTVATPVVALASDSGVSGNDHITNNDTLSLSGLESGGAVGYSIDGGASWSSSFTAGQGLNTVMVHQTDIAGNVSGSTTLSFMLDTTAPTVASIAMSDNTLKIGETSTVTITFSEAVTGFDATDVTIAHGTVGAFATADGGTTWTATFTPAANSEYDGNVVTVQDGSYTDLAGNAGSGLTG